MIPSKEQLEAQANAVIAAAKETVESGKDFPMMIVMHINSRWQRCPFPDELGSVMNNGKLKDLLFQGLRDIVQQMPADGIVIASDTWHAETTPEGFKHHDTPEWRKLHESGFDKLVQRGWVKRWEAFVVTAQSATDALIVRQKYQRLPSGRVQLLDCRRDWFSQSEFGGRMKMFGDLRWENLGSEAAVKGQS
jgi:hypothetical protein